MADLHALTIQQPHLWAITDLPERRRKDVENRDRRMPRKLVGRWIALHAGLTFDARGARTMRALERKAPQGFGLGGGDLQLPRGAICALARVPQMFELTGDGEFEWGSRWAVGRWCYVLASPVKLSTPIPCRGLPGFFRVPEAARLEAMRQVDALRDPLDAFLDRMRELDRERARQRVLALDGLEAQR